MESKKELRSKMMLLREQMDENEKAVYDERLCQQLLEIVAQRRAQTIHTYLPIGSEVNLYPAIAAMLKKGLTLVAPKTLPKGKLKHLVLHSLNALEKGIFGTLYPAGSYEYKGGYDLIIVPGLAFDLQFNRIGYGAGYYDAFLKNHPTAYKLALCYPFQVLQKLAVEPHDIPVDSIFY